MNVLLLIPSINPGQGGPVVVLEQFARYQTQDGDRIHVVSFDDPDDEFVRGFKYPLTALGPCSTFYGYTPKLVPWLREHAKEYDVVVVHGIWQYQSLAAWVALRKANVPYVIYTHGMLDPGHNKVSTWKHVKKQIYWLLCEGAVMRGAASVFFTTEEERRIAPRGVRPVRWKRSDIVPYGVEAPPGQAERQREIFLERFPELRGRRLLLFLGRFDPKKGAKMLIQAFVERAEQMPDVTLVMAGPSGTREARDLRKLIVARLRKRIVWTGMLLGDEKWGAFHAADAFIIPSHTENYCIAAVESLACGLPVLMSDKVNIFPMVDEAGAGFVENDDQLGCGNLIDRWLHTSGDEWKKMREQALFCYRKNFMMDDAYRQYRKALKSVASGSRREA